MKIPPLKKNNLTTKERPNLNIQDRKFKTLFQQKLA